MTAKEKAIKLVNDISCEVEQLPYSFCKELAKLTVTEIKKAFTEYGKENFELKNIDEELWFWDNVRNEINKL